MKKALILQYDGVLFSRFIKNLTEVNYSMQMYYKELLFDFESFYSQDLSIILFYCKRIPENSCFSNCISSYIN